ncbi:MAG: guanylate kinase [Alphaproteobacteria bacterium]|nr:guanylate kinase [Alphaproteobacteria bacterium]
MKKGLLFIISGPSAVGKTTVASEFLKEENNLLSRIVTCTSRTIRNGEVNGVDYYFLTREEFIQHKKNGDFVEMSEVYGNYYGVLLSTIHENIEQGKDSLLVINWEGYLKIKKIFKSRVIGIFLTPPSIEDLETRIRNRGTDSEEIIKQRMKMIEEDMRHKHEFEFCIENAILKHTVTDIINIVRNEIKKRET